MRWYFSTELPKPLFKNDFSLSLVFVSPTPAPCPGLENGRWGVGGFSFAYTPAGFKKTVLLNKHPSPMLGNLSSKRKNGRWGVGVSALRAPPLLTSRKICPLNERLSPISSGLLWEKGAHKQTPWIKFQADTTRNGNPIEKGLPPSISPSNYWYVRIWRRIS